MNRNRMTEEQIEAELRNNEPRLVERPFVVPLGRLVVWLVAPFADDRTIDRICQWFGKRAHNLKVGRITYSWRDFDAVRQIWADELGGK